MSDISLMVGNVWTKVVTSNRSVHKLLYDKLAVWKEGYFYSQKYRQGYWDGKIHFYDVYNCRFLTGLLSRVEDILAQQGYDFVKSNLIEYQPVEVAELSLEGIDKERFDKVQLPLIQEVLRRGRCTVRLATGGGKTEVIAGICKALPDKSFLVLVHRLELLDQTIKRLQRRLNEEVGCISASQIDIKRVTVGMVKSVWNRRHAVMSWLRNGVYGLIVDECHHTGALTWIRVSQICNAVMRIGLSGTPLRGSAVEDTWLVGLTGDVVQGLGIKELVDLGYAALPSVRLVYIDDIDTSNLATWHDIVQYVYGSVQVKEAVYDTFKNCHGREPGLVVFVDRVAQGQALKSFLEDVDSSLVVEMTSGKIDKEVRMDIVERMKKREIDILIATSVLDEGVDIASVSGILFLCSNKSVVKILQRIGRGVRPSDSKSVVNVYDLVIKAKYLKEHSLKRMRLYKKEGFRIEGIYVNGAMEAV